MELTPIKIRGKRGRSRDTTRRPRNKRARAALAVEGGESNSRSEDAAISLPPTRASTRRSKTKTKPQPALLRMPQEILELIYLASRSVSLPLASRDLYRRLSGDSTRRRLVEAAFGPTWHDWYGLPVRKVVSYRGWETDGKHIAGDPEFQSAVLSAGWAKLPIIQGALENWARRHGSDHPPRPPFLAIEYPFPQLRRETPPPGAGGDDDKAPSEPSWADKFAEGLAALAGLMEWCPGRGDDRLRHFRLLEVHPQTRIPDELLSGPYDVPGRGRGPAVTDLERVQRLSWLVHAGGRLQLDSQTWETTLQGFRHIVDMAKRGNRVATAIWKLFAALRVFDKQWPAYILREECDRVRAQLRGLQDPLLLTAFLHGLESDFGPGRGP